MDSGCVIPEDYLSIVEEYEINQSRLNVRKQAAFGLVDFISEEVDG